MRQGQNTVRYEHPLNNTVKFHMIKVGAKPTAAYSQADAQEVGVCALRGVLISVEAYKDVCTWKCARHAFFRLLLCEFTWIINLQLKRNINGQLIDWYLSVDAEMRG